MANRLPADVSVTAPGDKIVPMKAGTDGRCFSSLVPSASRSPGIPEYADCPGTRAGDYALQIEPIFVYYDSR